MEIADNAVGATAIVNVFQSFATHGDELALVVGGARRLGIPAHHPWPQNVGFAFAHLLDVAFQLLVGANRHLRAKLFVGVNLVITMFCSPLCLFPLADEVAEYLELDVFCSSGIFLQLLLSFREIYLVQKTGRIHYIIGIWVQSYAF